MFVLKANKIRNTLLSELIFIRQLITDNRALFAMSFEILYGLRILDNYHKQLVRDLWGPVW